MPSNWKIKDYSSQLKQSISLSPLLIEVRDEFVASVLRQKIKEHLPGLRIIFGGEVTVGLLEDELLGLNLFSQSEHYLILNAHDMSKAVIDFLLQTKIAWQQNPTIFIATKRNQCLNKCLAEVGHHHYLEWPKFWEMNQLLDFFVSHCDLLLDGGAKKFLMESVEQTSRHYFEACHLLKNEYPESGMLLNRQHVEQVVSRNRLDQFALAKQLGGQNLREFYTTLLGKDYSFDEMRQAFSFLQSHVVKLLDSSYVQKKGRPSQYDRQIMADSQHWQAAKLVKLLQQLAQFELACKQRDPGLKNQLRLGLFRVAG